MLFEDLAVIGVGILLLIIYPNILPYVFVFILIYFQSKTTTQYNNEPIIIFIRRRNECLHG